MNKRETFYFTENELKIFNTLGIERKQVKYLIKIGIITILQEVQKAKENSR